MYYLSDYQTFTSKSELNEAITEHFDRCRYQLNETERTVFLMLARHAVKYPGVAHLKTATIALAIGKTGRTVRRALASLVVLDMIEKVPFMRKVSGGNGANLFLIVHPSTSTREVVAKPTGTSVEAPETETEPITLLSNNTNSTSDTKRGLRDKMPAFIYDSLSPYLNAGDLFTAYGALLRGKSAIDRSITFESNEGLFTDAIMSVINAYKRGAVRSIPAVLYTAIKDTTAQIYRKEYYNVPDWLAFVTH